MKVKGKIIQTSAWPKALHGCELFPLGSQHYEPLRSLATSCLLGCESRASPYLACNALLTKLQDPEEYVTLLCLRHFRRFLLRNPGLMVESLNRVISHPANYQRVYGPCGTFAYTRNKLGWTISAEAELQCDLPTTIHLLDAPWPCIQQHVHLAWMRIVAVRTSHRKLMTDVLHVSTKNTAAVLSMCEFGTAKTAARQICGGYQHGTRKAIWLAGYDGACAMCGAMSINIGSHSALKLKCKRNQKSLTKSWRA